MDRARSDKSEPDRRISEANSSNPPQGPTCPDNQSEFLRSFYCVSKKSCPFMYNASLHKNGADFSDIQ